MTVKCADMHREIVKVSEISMFFLCPRIVYFQATQPSTAETAERREARMRRMAEKMLLRELAFKLPEMMHHNAAHRDAAEHAEHLARIIIEDVRYVCSEFRKIDNDLLNRIYEDFTEFLRRSWIHLTAGNDVVKTEMKHGFRREHMMFASTLRMSGCVDKMIEIGDEKVPCIIRTGRCPEKGVWAADRATLAAYAFLIEETYNTTVDRGFVEYIREASFRETAIRRSDRVMALHALKRVRAIKNGKFPERGEHAPCHLCMFSEDCDVRGATLLSKLGL